MPEWSSPLPWDGDALIRAALRLKRLQAPGDRRPHETDPHGNLQDPAAAATEQARIETVRNEVADWLAGTEKWEVELYAISGEGTQEEIWASYIEEVRGSKRQSNGDAVPFDH